MIEDLQEILRLLDLAGVETAESERLVAKAKKSLTGMDSLGMFTNKLKIIRQINTDLLIAEECSKKAQEIYVQAKSLLDTLNQTSESESRSESRSVPGGDIEADGAWDSPPVEGRFLPASQRHDYVPDFAVPLSKKDTDNAE